MHRRTSQLPYALAVSFFVSCMLALAISLVLGTPATRPTPRALAHPLHDVLTSSIPLLINEVYDSSNARLEYFELLNTSTILTPTTIDLSAYSIYNNDTNPIGITSLGLLTGTNRLIAPGEHKAIGPTQLGTSALVGNGFDNTGDYLGLLNTPSDAVVDLVNWGNVPNPNWNAYSMFAPYFFFSNIPQMPSPDGQNSLSRYPDGYDTDSPSDWRSLSQSPGFANTTPTPTPGGVTPTVGCLDRYEPDDTSASAKEIIQNTEQVHTLCHSDGTKDRDWTFFPAVADKVYTLLTKDLTGPVDTIITLYDAAGNVLAENDDATPGQGLNSRIDYVFSASGVYYLQTRDKRANGGLGYQYTLSFISTGQLPPTGTTTPSPTFNPNAPTVTPTSGVCYDAYEPDGVPETAKLLLVGTEQRPSVQHHSICPETDADWVRFFARAGKVYPIQTSNLGVGLDTFIILFDSDARTILAQNDDGGDGVASRIDFYPEKDGWYYVQVKNAGDIGGPDITYDLSLYVVPGVPAPPFTATPGGPPVTGTPAARTPTVPVGPTKPPVPTPTQGVPQITPTPRPTTLTAPQPQTTPEPKQTVLGGTGGQVATETPGPNFPNMPDTGKRIIDDSTQKDGKDQALVQQPGSSQAVASMLFRVFYDRNRDQTYDSGEGVRGIKVYFMKADPGGVTMSGQLVTSDIGTGNLMLPAVQQQRIYVPYLGINVSLNKFPEREAHSLWLPPVKLPDRVP